MKNKKLKSILIASGIFIALFGLSVNVTGQQFLCKWDNKWQWCMISAPDGYCAYGGDSCQSTIPTVE